MKAESGALSPQERSKTAPCLKTWMILAGLFLLMRLGGLLLFHPVHSSLFPIEEYYRGVMAMALWKQGPGFAYLLRPDDFCGGSLVMTLLTSIFFKCFGASAFILKSVSVFISLAALGLWFRILYQQISPKCARYFGLVFIFAPASFQIYSMVPLGDHYETIFISALAAWIFFQYQNRRFVPVFILGAVCGFGIWFAYIFSLTVLSILILSVWKKAFRPSFSGWIVMAAGFVTGFSPWLIINFKSGFAGGLINGVPILDNLQLPSWNETHFFVRDVLAALGAPAGRSLSGYSTVKFLYLVLFTFPVCAFFLLKNLNPVRREADSSQCSILPLYFAVYAALHCAAVQFTRFEGERYLMPLLPAIFFGWAFILARLEEFSIRAMTASRMFFLIPMLGLGGWLWISMTSPFYAGHLLKTKGYAYDYLSVIPACADYDDCLRLHHDLSKDLSERDRRELWIAFASKAAGEWIDREEPFPFGAIKIAEFKPAFYFHLGRHTLHRYGGEWEQAEQALRKVYPENSQEWAAALLGMTNDFGNYASFDQLQRGALTAQDSEVTRAAGFYQGLGAQFAFYWRRQGATAAQFYDQANVYLREWRAENRKDFFRGSGRYFVQNLYHMPVILPKDYAAADQLFENRDRDAFFEGVGMGMAELESFYPESYHSWQTLFMRGEKDRQVLSAVQKGRERLQSALRAFSIGI